MARRKDAGKQEVSFAPRELPADAELRALLSLNCARGVANWPASLDLLPAWAHRRSVLKRRQCSSGPGWPGGLYRRSWGPAAGPRTERGGSGTARTRLRSFSGSFGMRSGWQKGCYQACVVWQAGGCSARQSCTGLCWAPSLPDWSVCACSRQESVSIPCRQKTGPSRERRP